jgi:hypothetical protein
MTYGIYRWLGFKVAAASLFVVAIFMMQFALLIYTLWTGNLAECVAIVLIVIVALTQGQVKTTLRRSQPNVRITPKADLRTSSP